MKVKCPHCQSETLFAPENPFRPFCSERCRVIDLGAWADEAYRVPTQEHQFEETTATDSDQRGEH